MQKEYDDGKLFDLFEKCFKHILQSNGFSQELVS